MTKIYIAVSLLFVLLSCSAPESSPRAVGSASARAQAPDLEVVNRQGFGFDVRVDVAAMNRWTSTQGLPDLPAVDSLDGPTYRRFYEATVAASTDTTGEDLGTLGMLFDGYVMPDAALDCYRMAGDLDPLDFRWHHLIGIQLASRGQTEEAIRSFLQSLVVEERNAAALARIADLYLQEGDLGQAGEYFERYGAERPDDGVASFGLARVAERSGDPGSAMIHLQRSLEQKPEHRAAHYLASRILPKIGRADEVDSHLRAAEALAGDAELEAFDEIAQGMQKVARTQAYLRKGMAYFRETGDFERALEFAAELAERRPDDLVVHQVGTWLATVLRRYAVAGEFARQAVALDPSFAPGWEAIARALALEDQNELALEAIDRALEEDPHYSHARIVRAMSLLQIGRPEEAIENLDVALRDYPDDLDGHVISSMARLQLGERDEARKALEKTLEIDPNHRWARETLDGLDAASEERLGS